MSKALNQISKSPFTHKIERATLPRRFHQPTFTIYNGRMDPVEHVSHFSQKMAIHSKDEALMCKVFLSSLGPVVMRWFDGLRVDSIDSFKELTQAFGSCYITCTRVPQPLDSLLSLSMREREIDHLKRKLRHAQRRRTPSPSDSSFDDEKDSSY